jgi:hypothetical protein
MLATFAKPEAATEENIQEFQDNVPYLDLTVPHDDLFNGAAAVMKALFPQLKTDDISYIQFKDGITNKCKLPRKKCLFFFQPCFCVCFFRIGSTFESLHTMNNKTDSLLFRICSSFFFLGQFEPSSDLLHR